jgi:hypothetical protein
MDAQKSTSQQGFCHVLSRVAFRIDPFPGDGVSPAAMRWIVSIRLPMALSLKAVNRSLDWLLKP